MRNWVFCNFAQSITNPEDIFDKLYMVAADVRSDMFADGFNLDAPCTNEERTQDNLKHGVILQGNINMRRCVALR